MNVKTRLWFGTFVALVFIAGVATGSLLERIFNRPAFAFASPAPPGPGMLADVFAEELKLTSDQRTQIEAIFESRRPQLKLLRDSVRDKFEEERKTMDAEIEKLLTPEQRDRFHEINERLRARPFPPRPF